MKVLRRWFLLGLSLPFGIMSDIFHFFTPLSDRFFTELSNWAWGVEADLTELALGGSLWEYYDGITEDSPYPKTDKY